MITLENTFSAILSFLNEAQKLGIVKEFSLVHREINETESCDARQLLSKFVNTFASQPVNIKEEFVNSEECPDTLKNEVDSKNEINNVEESPEKNLVQIQVDESEVKRRISAFICRKRKEVDEWNVQEFCNRPYVEDQNPIWEQVDSCARVDTVFIPRLGCKSHVKVSKVENRWGPQTHMPPETKMVKLEPNTDFENQPNDSFQAVEERLQNIESHLKLGSQNSARVNIFQRLKQLEDRILYLEGISPDYFHLPGPDYQSPKKKTHSDKGNIHSGMSLDDLQKRMKTLKNTLKRKPRRIKSEPAE